MKLFSLCMLTFLLLLRFVRVIIMGSKAKQHDNVIDPAEKEKKKVMQKEEKLWHSVFGAEL